MGDHIDWIAPEKAGSYPIHVRATDPWGAYLTGDITVQVGPTPQTNHPPTIEAFEIDKYEFGPHEPVDLHLRATDPDGDGLRYTIYWVDTAEVGTSLFNSDKYPPSTGSGLYPGIFSIWIVVIDQWG